MLDSPWHCIALLCVHCCSVSSAISLNASVFAAVCLASRLSSSLDAFVMVALAVQLFALFPELRNSLRVSVLILPYAPPTTNVDSKAERGLIKDMLRLPVRCGIHAHPDTNCAVLHTEDLAKDLQCSPQPAYAHKACQHYKPSILIFL